VTVEAAQARTRRLTAVRREEARVTALELFFDLVFVLALTQCTALIAATPTWSGLVQALFVLAVLWWSWGGYAWLTSVVDPEEGAVRIAMFAAMAAFLVAALAVPHAFGDDALVFACAYGVVRVAHIWLFTMASRDDPGLRRSVTGLASSTAIGRAEAGCCRRSASATMTPATRASTPATMPIQATAATVRRANISVATRAAATTASTTVRIT